jgi:hypothetical protein
VAHAGAATVRARAALRDLTAARVLALAMGGAVLHCSLQEWMATPSDLAATRSLFVRAAARLFEVRWTPLVATT